MQIGSKKRDRTLEGASREREALAPVRGVKNADPANQRSLAKRT